MTTNLTILAAYGEYHVTVDIGPDEYELGSYATAYEAADAARKWVTDRGLRWGRSSARRLAEAQRMNACCVTFEVIAAEHPTNGIDRCECGCKYWTRDQWPGSPWRCYDCTDTFVLA